MTGIHQIIDSRTKNRSTLTTVLLVVCIAVLLFLQFRGCHQSKMQLSKFNKIDSLNNVLLGVVANDKIATDSTKTAFQDSLAFVNGQLDLATGQKLRTEIEIRDISKENKTLIARYKLGEYADTSAIVVPNEFVIDCQGCFTNLEKTTALVDRYSTDISNMEAKQEKQNLIYQRRFKELDEEKLGFYNKVNALAKEQKKAIDDIRPRGRLYLSWGVLWRPWPVAGGAGLMYQNKRNLMYGLKGYYGQGGTTVETTINIPLSLKFK